MQKKNVITERETLEALWGIEKLQYNLTGREFVLIVDHKALEELKRKVSLVRSEYKDSLKGLKLLILALNIGRGKK